MNQPLLTANIQSTRQAIQADKRYLTDMLEQARAVAQMNRIV